jgi:hypothetical protein
MSKVVYAEHPEAMELPQRVWVREEDQPASGPEDLGDYFLDPHYPH